MRVREAKDQPWPLHQTEPRDGEKSLASGDVARPTEQTRSLEYRVYALIKVFL